MAEKWLRAPLEGPPVIIREILIAINWITASTITKITTNNFFYDGTSNFWKIFFNKKAIFVQAPYIRNNHVVSVMFMIHKSTQIIYVDIEYPYMHTIWEVLLANPRHPKKRPIKAETRSPIT